MVNFSGKVEGRIQASVITLRSRFLAVIGIAVAAVGLIISVIVWLAVGSPDSCITILICSIIIAIISGILFIPSNVKRLRFIWNFDIKIEKDIISLTFNHQNGIEKKYKTAKVKKIIDYGEYYYISFYRIDPSNGIVCQKNLLVSGTLEEFEKLFEGKIRRKIK